MKEEKEHLIEVQSTSCIMNDCNDSDNETTSWTKISNMLLPIILSLIILTYLSLFFISFIPAIPFSFTPLSRIINPKAFQIDWLFFIQFFLSLFELTCLIISFILIHYTKGEEIPDDPIWSLKSSKTNSPQQKMEEIALQFIQREECLNQNRNQLYSFNYQNDDSAFQGSTFDSSHDNNNNNNCNDDNSVVAYDDYIIINERKANNEIRYCKKCNKFKPDRAHHCNQCNKCYLKLDHHSIWFNKCISYSNYKYYITFLFYGWNLSLLFLIKYAPHFAYAFQHEQLLVSLITFCIAYLLTIGVFIVFFSYWGYNIYLVLNNFTSIEYMKFENNKDKIKRSEHDVNYSQIDSNYTETRRYSIKYASRYCISKWENWTQLFSDNAFLWFFPIKSELRDSECNQGINFKVNHYYSTELVKSI